MKKLKLLLLTGFILSNIYSFAQTNSVSGVAYYVDFSTWPLQSSVNMNETVQNTLFNKTQIVAEQYKLSTNSLRLRGKPVAADFISDTIPYYIGFIVLPVLKSAGYIELTGSKDLAVRLQKKTNGSWKNIGGDTELANGEVLDDGSSQIRVAVTEPMPTQIRILQRVATWGNLVKIVVYKQD